jgi:hypothetical protein
MVAAWELADWTSRSCAPPRSGARRAARGEARITSSPTCSAHWALDDSKTPADFRRRRPAFGAEPLPEDVEKLLAYRGRRLEFAEAFQ